MAHLSVAPCHTQWRDGTAKVTKNFTKHHRLLIYIFKPGVNRGYPICTLSFPCGGPVNDEGLLVVHPFGVQGELVFAVEGPGAEGARVGLDVAVYCIHVALQLVLAAEHRAAYITGMGQILGVHVARVTAQSPLVPALEAAETALPIVFVCLTTDIVERLSRINKRLQRRTKRKKVTKAIYISLHRGQGSTLPAGRRDFSKWAPPKTLDDTQNKRN